MSGYLVNTVAVVAVILVLASAYVRFVPTVPDRWHIDPLTAASPGQAGVLARVNGGDIVPIGYDEGSAELLARLDKIIRATPRTKHIAGSIEDGRLTYLTRSRGFGFPDFATVTVEQVDGQSFPVILSRLRFGKSDLGVNRRRVSGWLSALEQRG
ncbi:DUF1499 domain-containing protein [Actibacterium lipolyticum]|uniref:DUF1499 domain-containing protein n=1 Tax=Actibacterium lipolyticum TaxID=1524263 RepID=A0A238JV26_9RHOB|nr:DUF1499 domain-containing protein [Actibacterium lipolyticum]SMX34490.1 hypothetical protein COL8621_01335 [Actibacterium lipolyticum]